ncbi:VC0807 family protein [Mesobacillus subterraneus]|uniref:VC0807 family protein n=1 Tax=Mesobacillus subterraneus TaxID=285983 RepID=UPI001CFD4FB6|nr:VC0807 family protein [Mesobacillus subterraneus]WLR57309.1 VC0807 family protein [Mesobacillus subterraneus]
MKKNVLILDLIFYVGLPLLFWNGFRDVIGDYYAMLASSVPAIIYSLYRFYEVKKINITGLYIITTLVIGTLIDVLAGSALQMLWNNVFYNVAIGTLFLCTIVIKRPMAMYFGLDFAELQGHDRIFCKHLFKQKEIYIIFQLVTLLIAIRSGVFAAIKAWLIIEYGVEAFDKGILIRQAIGWLFTGLTMFGFFYTSKVIKDHPEILKRVEEELYGVLEER